MLSRKRGAIVNIGSAAATVLPADPLYSVYAGTKGCAPAMGGAPRDSAATQAVIARTAPAHLIRAPLVPWVFVWLISGSLTSFPGRSTLSTRTKASTSSSRRETPQSTESDALLGLR